MATLQSMQSPAGKPSEAGGEAMTTVETVKNIPWWKEPTKDQWLAWVAAWLGWTLDAFDFTIFLLIMLPIAQEFSVPLTAVTAVFTLTLWMRLLGATASGWLADRVGRKTRLGQPDRFSPCRMAEMLRVDKIGREVRC